MLFKTLVASESSKKKHKIEINDISFSRQYLPFDTRKQTFSIWLLSKFRPQKSNPYTLTASPSHWLLGRFTDCFAVSLTASLFPWLLCPFNYCFVVSLTGRFTDYLAVRLTASPFHWQPGRFTECFPFYWLPGCFTYCFAVSLTAWPFHWLLCCFTDCFAVKLTASPFHLLLRGFTDCLAVSLTAWTFHWQHHSLTVWFIIWILAQGPITQFRSVMPHQLEREA